MVGCSKEEGDASQETIEDDRAKADQVASGHYHGPTYRRNHSTTQDAIELEKVFTHHGVMSSKR